LSDFKSRTVNINKNVGHGKCVLHILPKCRVALFFFITSDQLLCAL